jgi:hypothetical protein
MNKHFFSNQRVGTNSISFIFTNNFFKIHPSTLSNKFSIVICLVASLFLFGCASTKISDRERLVYGEIPQPGNILVYDFAASISELPTNSALYGHPDVDTTPPTASQLAEGKKLGALIASNLVTDIRSLGMPAELAWDGIKPQLNDLVIRGYLISVNKGNEGERVIIGFGGGSSDLKTAVEVFQMTPKGLRKLGSGDLNAEGAKTPGGILGLATLAATHNPLGLIISGGIHVYGEETGSSKVEGRAKQTAKEISDVLKKQFQEQGWI